MSELLTITAVVTERTSPRPPVSPWPLIYTLQVTDPNDDGAIRRQIADIRYNEIEGGDEEQDSDLIDAICEGIEVHFIFEGDVRCLVDFRE